MVHELQPSRTRPLPLFPRLRSWDMPKLIWMVCKISQPTTKQRSRTVPDNGAVGA